MASLAQDAPILIVHDSPTMCRLLRKQLTQIGYLDVEEARDAASVMAKIKDGQFRLLISDSELISIDITALLQSLRAAGATEGLSILILTSDLNLSADAPAVTSDVDGYLRKPVACQDLAAQIEPLLGVA